MLEHEDSIIEQEGLKSLLNDYHETFTSAAGQNVLDDLMLTFYHRLYAPDPESRCADAEAHFINGQRHTVLHIMQMVEDAKALKHQAEEDDEYDG